jgi:hypothetical protein
MGGILVHRMSGWRVKGGKSSLMVEKAQEKWVFLHAKISLYLLVFFFFGTSA